MHFGYLIPAIKFFAIVTSFRGGTAGSKSAGDRNLEICHNSATEGDRDNIGVKMRRRVNFLCPSNRLMAVF